MTQVAIEKLSTEIAKIVGSENYSTSQLILYSYTEDASPFEGVSPLVVIRPQDSSEIAKIIQFAASHDLPIVPVGGRSGISGAAIPRVPSVIMLDLTRMNKILSIDEDIATVTVQTGITWAELLHKLSEKNFTVGFRGPYGGNAGTIGGSLSSNSVGIGASAYGGACDNVVSLQVVLADGRIIETGSGWKTTPDEKLKYFARYCTFNDLTGIFLGDHGTLGVKTQATLKIYPISEGTSFIDFGFTSIEECAKALQHLQKYKIPTEAVILGDSTSIDLLASIYHEKFPLLTTIVGIIIEEFDQDLANKKKDICEQIAKQYGGKSVGTFLSKAHWLNKFNLVQSLFEEGFWYNTCHLRPISTLPSLIHQVHTLFEKYDLKSNGITWIISALATDRCYCTGWITLFLSNPKKRPLLEKVWHELRNLEISTNGVPYWTGLIWEEYVLQRVNPVFYDTMRKIKDSLDPHHLFHPHVFGFQEGMQK
ncbi:MAG TPA: FAD-binding oxidoreductase [Candidatus Deferrimicrobium sp.]|nr:FAD-binding oxidoreductase [Candidatus Deferrimicrobium sp.]